MGCSTLIGFGSYIKERYGVKWRASEEEESKLKAFVHNLNSSLFHFVHIINWILWVWMSENEVVISFYSPMLIGFILLSSLMDVGRIDWVTLNNSVLSSLSLLAYVASYLMLMIYHRWNNRKTPSWRLGSRSGSVKNLPPASDHQTTKEHKI